MRVLGWWMSLADFSVPIWLEQLADLQWNPSCSPSLTLSRSEAEGPEIVNQPVSAMPFVIHPENRQWMVALAEKEGFHFLHKVPEHPQPCCPCPITAHVCLDLSCWCAPNTETDMLPWQWSACLFCFIVVWNYYRHWKYLPVTCLCFQTEEKCRLDDVW